MVRGWCYGAWLVLWVVAGAVGRGWFCAAWLVLWGVGGAVTVGRDWCCGAWVMLWGVAGAVWRGSPATPGNRKIEARFCKNGCPGARGLAA